MALEQRFQGTDAAIEDSLPTHQFGYLMREYVRGKVTRSEALAAINSWLVTPLSPAEQADLAAIADSIDGAGSNLNKFARALEIEDVLGLMEIQTPGYQTVAEGRAKLGF